MFVCGESSASSSWKRNTERSEGVRNDGYEEKGGGGQKIVVECLRFWPKLDHLICQGLTPNCGVKGQREHLREMHSVITHTHMQTQTQVNMQTCVRVSLLCSLLPWAHTWSTGHLYKSSLISFRVLFVLLILSVMLTSGYEKIRCHFPKKHSMIFFPKQIIEKIFELQDAWIHVWVEKLWVLLDKHILHLMCLMNKLNLHWAIKF